MATLFYSNNFNTVLPLKVKIKLGLLRYCSPEKRKIISRRKESGQSVLMKRALFFIQNALKHKKPIETSLKNRYPNCNTCEE